MVVLRYGADDVGFFSVIPFDEVALQRGKWSIVVVVSIEAGSCASATFNCSAFSLMNLALPGKEYGEGRSFDLYFTDNR